MYRNRGVKDSTQRMLIQFKLIKARDFSYSVALHDIFEV